MATVTITKLKNIEELEFNIPVSGVHVLAGVNGSGKTTLLACLERIVNPFAFKKHFKTSQSDRFDKFSAGEIVYSASQNDSVKYQYRNTRWAPTPKRQASVVNRLGYASVIFIASSVDRFYVQNEELNTRGISGVSAFMKDSMNQVFQTTKYNSLKKVKLSGRGRRHGRWNYGFILSAASIAGQSNYYTEKNFSLGEILMLNALFDLEQVNNDSLVLIDEVELALHPKVQVSFLSFLEQISTQKNLTIILSTHSSTLIKSAQHLIYLENKSNGITEVLYDCYPAIVLQGVAISDEVQPDYVFCVEDIYAQYLLEHILDYYFRVISAYRKPISKILPIGGWKQTIQFISNASGYIISRNTKLFAFLDQDVNAVQQRLMQTPNLSASQQDELNLFRNNHQNIFFLPITPEKGICDLLTSNPAAHIRPIQEHFNGVFDINNIVISENSRGLTYSTNLRKAAKERLSFYVEKIHTATNIDEKNIQYMLAQYFVNQYFQSRHGALQQLLNPIFS